MIRGIIILLLTILSITSLAYAGQKFNNQAGHFDITGEIPVGSAPASSTTSCYKGNMKHDSTYLYICVDTNTWKRTQLTTWSLTDTLLLSTGGGTDKLLLDDGTSNLLLRQ